MVSEQIMAAHAKSKMAGYLLRLGFIDFVFGFRVQCLHLRRSVFGSRTNVFLSAKAETGAETRQNSSFFEDYPLVSAFCCSILRPLYKRRDSARAVPAHSLGALLRE